MVDILHLSRIPVYPPTNGREVRIWQTAQKLDEFGNVQLATPGERSEPPECPVTTVNLSNPLLATKIGYVHSWNAAFALGYDNPYDQLQGWLTRLDIDRSIEFDLVVCESPQMFRVGRRVACHDGASLLVNKHNVSHEILRQFLDSMPIPDLLTRRAVRNHAAHERWAINAADAVVFQSAADREQFDCPADTLVRTIPNGTAMSSDASQAAVAELRKNFAIDPEAFVCVFIGSYDYGPNRTAAQIIDRELAPRLSGVEFLLVGRNPPSLSADNVTPTGFVDDLSVVLSLANAALCPLQKGSGTKLKMMDYLAAGLPIVTTSVGASGIDVTDDETVLVRESPAAFVKAIRRLDDSPALALRLARNAREFGEQYAWDHLLADYDELLVELLGGPTDSGYSR